MKRIKAFSRTYESDSNWMQYAGNESWANGPLASFDLETDSADPTKARMVSAAIVLDVPGNDPVIKTWLVQVPSGISLNATAIHGISTEESVTRGVPLTTALPEVIAELSGLDMPIAVCNGSFDFTIVDREARRIGITNGFTPAAYIIDSLVCDRALDTYRRGRRTLTATLAAYNKAIKGAHRAEFDCIAVIELVRSMAGRYPEFGRIPLGMLQELQAQAYAAWATHFVEYRQRYGDNDFVCYGNWPLIPYDNVAPLMIGKT